jgi:predicted acetyltransferase
VASPATEAAALPPSPVPTAPPFRFLDPGPLLDGELELVPPAEPLIDDFLAAAHHPLSVAVDPAHASYTRERVAEFVEAGSRWRYASNPAVAIPSYIFWLRIRPGRHGIPVRIAGGISFRVSDAAETRLYYGHIGYNVFPPARGRHLAARATALLLPLARRHGMRELWITCNPDNLASRRTIERLGGTLVETIAVPTNHPLHQRGETEKCRYRINL